MGSQLKSSSGSLCILVVDDNAVNRIAVVRMLEKRGHVVDVAGDGLQAVRRSNDPALDLVFMDIQMPELDGIEACSRIRAREADNGEYLPVIAMSAHLDERNITKCLSVGMDAYIEKPIGVGELYDVIRKVAPLRQRALYRSDVCSIENVAEPESENRDELVGIAQALLLVDGDMNLLAESAQTFLNTCPELCEQMDEAIKQHDFQSISKQINCLGSGVRMFSTEELQIAMEYLQRDSKEHNSDGVVNSWSTVRDGIMRTSQLLRRLLERRCQLR